MDKAIEAAARVLVYFDSNDPNVLAREAIQAYKAAKWQPIDENTPCFGEELLFLSENGKYIFNGRIFGQASKQTDTATCEMNNRDVYVKAWQPLPQTNGGDDV